MAIVRQLLILIDPVEGLVGTFGFEDVADGNGSSAVFSCAYVPPSKGTGRNVAQETIFLGTAGAGKMFQAFRDDRTKDGSQLIKAVAVTQRIDPEYVENRDSVTKRFTRLFVPNSVNPTKLGARMLYCKDVDPQVESVTWRDFAGDDEANVKYFESPAGEVSLGEHFHIRIEDDTEQVNRDMFASFTVEYYPLGTSEDRNS